MKITKQVSERREAASLKAGRAIATSSSLLRRARRFIRTILVPVDFSECSLSGVTYAVRFAREVGARIIVLHVADLGPVMMTTGCGDYDSRIYADAARRRCSKQMQAFLKRVDFDGVPITMSAVAGYCRQRSTKPLKRKALI